jgi:hypothetical protein
MTVAGDLKDLLGVVEKQETVEDSVKNSFSIDQSQQRGSCWLSL